MRSFPPTILDLLSKCSALDQVGDNVPLFSRSTGMRGRHHLLWISYENRTSNLEGLEDEYNESNTEKGGSGFDREDCIIRIPGY